MRGGPANADVLHVDRRGAIGGAGAAVIAAAFASRAVAAEPAERLHRLTIVHPLADGMQDDALLARWVQNDAPGLIRARGLRALTFNLVDTQRTRDAAYAGVTQMDFDSLTTLDTMRAQAKRLFGKGAIMLSTGEQVIRRVTADRRAGAKRIGLVGRAPDKARGTFVEEWRDVHAPAVDRQPGLTGYSLNVADPDHTDAPWDGYAELWWPDWAIYESATKARLAEPSTRDFFHSRLLLLLQERFHVAV